MYQFFVEDTQISEKDVVIEGSDVNHIKNVLRMKCAYLLQKTDTFFILIFER